MHLSPTRDACANWLHEIVVTSRIGNPVDPANRSLHGALARLTGTGRLAGGWGLLVVGVAVSGLALAVAASRRGDESAGFSLAALSTLLAPPVSGSHRWTLAAPALVLLARARLPRLRLPTGVRAAVRPAATLRSASNPRFVLKGRVGGPAAWSSLRVRGWTS